jgi:tRNA A-37 threonylcarbamoyl transferase component Bud32
MPMALCDLRYLIQHSNRSNKIIIHNHSYSYNSNNILTNLLQQIYHIHQDGYLHYDIKPENIILFQNNGELYPQLIDFSLTSKPIPILKSLREN